MVVRRAFFRWMIPAAFVLPVWLLVGWGVFSGAAFGYLWVVLLGAPAVFVGELVLSLLVRARGTVRAERAVSWWDVVGFGLWHVATVAVGLYNPAFFGIAFAVALIAGAGLFWLSLWQLWREARGTTAAYLRSAEAMAAPPPTTSDERLRERAREHGEVIVLSESGGPQTGYPHPGSGR